jgi:hypothetical protein
MPTFDENQAIHWYKDKSRLMEEMLGQQHKNSMHSIMAYEYGGGLDLYYYPHGIQGVGIATKELTELPNQGSSNKKFSCYELAMFTRHPLDLEQAKNKENPFGKAHSNINKILNNVARYSATTELNPNETCEFPENFKDLGGKCLVFDDYGSKSDNTVRRFGILAVIEIFRSEMDFARTHGSPLLFEKLKAAGHYPYSDLDREPVV